MDGKKIKWDHLRPGPRRDVQKWLRRANHILPYQQDVDRLEFWEKESRPPKVTKKRKLSENYVSSIHIPVCVHHAIEQYKTDGHSVRKDEKKCKPRSVDELKVTKNIVPSQENPVSKNDAWEDGGASLGAVTVAVTLEGDTKSTGAGTEKYPVVTAKRPQTRLSEEHVCGSKMPQEKTQLVPVCVGDSAITGKGEEPGGTKLPIPEVGEESVCDKDIIEPKMMKLVSATPNYLECK